MKKKTIIIKKNNLSTFYLFFGDVWEFLHFQYCNKKCKKSVTNCIITNITISITVFLNL